MLVTISGKEINKENGRIGKCVMRGPEAYTHEYPGGTRGFEGLKLITITSGRKSSREIILLLFPKLSLGTTCPRA